MQQYLRWSDANVKSKSAIIFFLFFWTYKHKFLLALYLLQTEQVERNYIKEKKAAVKEFDDKKVELKENLIAELEEKKKMIENEKLTMELTGGKGARTGLLIRDLLSKREMG